MDIAAWLRELRLERCKQAFRENDIAPAVLPELTESDLGGLRAILELLAAAPTAGAGLAIEVRMPVRRVRESRCRTPV